MPFDPAVRQIIAGFRRSPAWDDELDLRLLRAFWPKLVGRGLAEATFAAGLAGSRLLLRVPDPTWKRQLLSIRPWLLARINELWPTRRITDIGFIYENQRS